MLEINGPTKEQVRKWLTERWKDRNPLPEMTQIWRALECDCLREPMPGVVPDEDE